MQVIEMVVFLIASIVIASLILLFIGGIEPKQIYENIAKLVFPQPIDVNAVLTTTKIGFVGKMGACWEQCAFGAKNLKCGTFYITDEGLQEVEKTLDKGYLEAIFEKYNYCTECSVTVEGGSIQLPAVVALKCENRELVVSR